MYNFSKLSVLKNILLALTLTTAFSCQNFYIKPEKETALAKSGQRVYSDLGKYEEDQESIYDYVSDDIGYEKSEKRKPSVQEINEELDSYQDPEYARNDVNTGYRARSKSINNYDYSLKSNEDITVSRRDNFDDNIPEANQKEESKGFFGKISSTLANFFIIDNKESSIKKETPKASLAQRNIPLHSTTLSKRDDWRGRLHFPVNHPEASMTSGFGWRKGKFHEGIDVAAPYGSVIEAAYDAKVLYSGDRLRGYGNMLVLQSRSGLVTVYSHNAKLYAKKGDVVKQGDIIALLGDSGSATAPHLHFEVRLANSNGDFVAVNPEGLFR